MIYNFLQLKEILNRIELKQHTDLDLAILTEALNFDSDGLPSIQIGKDNINIGTANDITIQNIYEGLKPEVIHDTIEYLLEQRDTSRNRLIKQLRKFEKTNKCSELIRNPKKIGFISTSKLLISHIMLLVVFLFVLYYVYPFNSIIYEIDFFLKISAFISIVCLVCIIYLIWQIVKYSRKIYRGEYITKTKHVYAIPVVVIRLHRTNDRLTRVSFSDSHNQAYYAVPHGNFEGSILCENDLGVAYLQERKSNLECDAKYVLMGFEL
jgi:hypothetical protein